MPGLNYGRKYLYSSNKRENTKERDFNREAVVLNEKTGVWVVRIRNTTKSKHLKPFVSVAQFPTQEEAEKFWTDYINR